MSVEVNPVGMACGAKRGGLSCVYCYEEPVAGAEAPLPTVNHSKVRQTVEALRPGRAGFSLFGGEPLMASVADLEELWRWGLEKFGKNGVQTSGRPITDEHFELFHKYKVSVGFSIDGPGELNGSRWAGSHEETVRATEHSLACLKRALAEGLGAGLIMTLHRKNASVARLPRLLEWFDELDGWGLRHGVLHLLEHDGPTKWLALDPEENLEALLAIHEHTLGLDHLHFDLFDDVRALLRGQDGGVGCTWNACDPFTTPAVQGVEADGSRAMCPRVLKGPTMWAPTPRGPLARQLVLRDTPQSEGGCQGCRQLITCKGQCPGTAEGGDWRKRSRDCATWLGLFEYFEGVLVLAGEKPVTLRPDRDQIEERLAEEWRQGRPTRLASLLGQRGGPAAPRGDHGDHQDHGDHDDLGQALQQLPGASKVTA